MKMFHCKALKSYATIKLGVVVTHTPTLSVIYALLNIINTKLYIMQLIEGTDL